MSILVILSLAMLTGSLFVYAACLSVLRQADASHQDMIRRHERWREESKQQWDSDMAALERMVGKLKAGGA